MENSYTIRVDAVTNFQHTEATEDELIVRDLVEAAALQSPETPLRAREIALSEPFLINRLVPPAAHVIGVNATQQYPRKSRQEVPEAVAYARNLAEQIRAGYPDIKVYLTGVTMMNNAFLEAGKKDTVTLTPLMYLAMFVVIFFFLRSVSATFATIIVMIFSMLVGVGAAGWIRFGLTPTSLSAPTIIMTLAVADYIHILVTMLQEMAAGKSKQDAIVESMRINMQPVFLTSVSTVIGFLTLNFVEVPPFNHLGNMVAAGVTGAFGLAVFFLPALLAVLPMRSRKAAIGPQSWIDRFADFVIGYRRPLLWGTSLAALGLVALIPQNQLDDRFVEYFDQSIEFRRDTDFTVENLRGPYQLNFSLGSGKSGGINEPEYLAKIDEFATWFRQQPKVRHVSVLTDVMKRLNKNMHADDPAYYRLPGNRNLAAQYLLLYEMSLPYGLDLNNQINVDKSATVLS